MPTAKVAYDAFPWTLRLQHSHYMDVRLERRGRCIRFDPYEPVGADDIVVLTWAFPEQLRATADAVSAGARPTVLAAPEVLAWLEGKGEVDGHPLVLSDSPVPLAAPVTIDGVRLQGFGYTPIPWATAPEAVRKVRSALRRPDRALGRLARKLTLPRTGPLCMDVTLPNGDRFLHLNLALHSGTRPDWLDQAAARFGGPRWLLCGVDHEEADAFKAHLPALGAKQVLVVDLIGEVRRSLGLPTELLTPVVDALVQDGLDAYVFATQASFRFE